MTRRHLPVLLADRLYVPEHKVTREHKEAFTHIITQTAYVQEKGLPKRCGTCSWWMKAWKDNRDRKTFCHNLGYGEYDLCKDYEVRSIKDVVEEEVRTYKELPKHGYVAFARGDEGKLREVFGDKLIDRAEDDRSTRSLGIPLELGGPNKVVLRDYQRPLIRTWRKRGGIIIAPTGAGKGTMLCALIAKLKHRVLILSQEVRHLTAVMAELKESTNIDELQKQYDTPLMGMLQTKGRMAGKVYPITFATFQLFSHSNGRKLLKKIKDKFGHAHVEEVHHAAARTWFKTLSTLNPLFRTGSTATMERKDQLHPVIFDAIGPVVAESKTEMMPCEITYIKSGVFVPEQALRRFGQYKWGGMLTYVGNRPELMDTVTLNVMGDVAKGYKPLVISERRNFAIALAKNLEILGAKTKLIMGGEKKTVKQKRSLENQWKPVSDALARGDLNVIVGTGVMNEAVNIPPLSALHLPFPSANPGQEKQRAGRIRRPMKGKPTPQIRVYTFEGDPIAATGCHKTRRGVYAKLGFVTKGEQAPDRNPLVAREVSAKPGSKIRSLASLPVPVKARWSGGGG